jgi:hypothetical protein
MSTSASFHFYKPQDKYAPEIWLYRHFDGSPKVSLPMIRETFEKHTVNLTTRQVNCARPEKAACLVIAQAPEWFEIVPDPGDGMPEVDYTYEIVIEMSPKGDLLVWRVIVSETDHHGIGICRRGITLSKRTR